MTGASCARGQVPAERWTIWKPTKLSTPGALLSKAIRAGAKRPVVVGGGGYDQRFWTAYVSSSGEGGAKLHRRDWGESVENMGNIGAYHWAAGNFLKYSGPLHSYDLPVDSHELIAMCAPRPVFLSGGKGGYDAEPGGDSWVDAKGSFLAGEAAGPVYKLLGKKPMVAVEFPPSRRWWAMQMWFSRQHSSNTPMDQIGLFLFLDFAKHLELSAGWPKTRSRARPQGVFTLDCVAVARSVFPNPMLPASTSPTLAGSGAAPVSKWRSGPG